MLHKLQLNCSITMQANYWTREPICDTTCQPDESGYFLECRHIDGEEFAHHAWCPMIQTFLSWNAARRCLGSGDWLGWLTWARSGTTMLELSGGQSVSRLNKTYPYLIIYQISIDGQPRKPQRWVEWSDAIDSVSRKVVVWLRSLCWHQPKQVLCTVCIVVTFEDKMSMCISHIYVLSFRLELTWYCMYLTLTNCYAGAWVATPLASSGVKTEEIDSRVLRLECLPPLISCMHGTEREGEFWTINTQSMNAECTSCRGSVSAHLQ